MAKSLRGFEKTTPIYAVEEKALLTGNPLSGWFLL
jgi:hypothetical protein